MVYNGNKYYFTKAAMKAVDKVPNISQYTDENLNWKVVSNVLRLLVNGDVKMYVPSEEDDKE